MAIDSRFWRRRRVLVTGGGGFVGRNLVPLLEATGCELSAPSRQDYDLLEQRDVRRMIADTRPSLVIHLAGRVGGILANRDHPAEFCYENLIMGTMMLHESWAAGVEKYVTLIGGCSYPAHAPNPITEDTLWDGYPQTESAPYSIAKKMSVVQAQAYRKQYGFDAIVLVPGNLYGPWDNFDPTSSHVIPALIRRFHEAKITGCEDVIAWGSGAPVRDFVYAADACEAIIRATASYNRPEIVNISSGTLTTIKDLTHAVAQAVGYPGRVVWDTSKPDGQVFKQFDVRRMRDWLGYECSTSLTEGLAKTVTWFAAYYAAHLTGR